jgi:hypothetical protein
LAKIDRDLSTMPGLRRGREKGDRKSKSHDVIRRRAKMKNDVYLRIILTIIALCLVWNIVKPFAIQTAQAEPGITSVNIAEVGGKAIGRVLPVEQK